MTIRPLTDVDKEKYNKIVSHIIQSWEWGEFRKKTGVGVVRLGIFEKEKLTSAYQLTIHSLPYTKFTIGYLPKSDLPSKEVLEELIKIGQEENCIFIQLEPNIIKDIKILGYKDTRKNEKALNILISKYPNIRPSTHPLFTRYTFQLDLTKSEEELLAAMHPKTRYNIKVAQKHGVKVVEDNSEKAFKIYLKLLKETTGRQKFYAHDEKYHAKMWETLRPAGIAHLLIAKYKPPSAISYMPLAAWILFVYDGVLYYPYGASSDKYKEAMASNLMMFEAIRLGKKLSLKTFDLWGSLGPDPNKNDSWYGFHRFKEGYGGKLVEFVGSYDLVIKPFWYRLYILVDKLRWAILKMV